MAGSAGDWVASHFAKTARNEVGSVLIEAV
jgi:hypothetical protein